MGGFDGSAVDFSWMLLSNGRGLRGTRWSSAGGRGDTGGQGVSNQAQLLPRQGAPLLF